MNIYKRNGGGLSANKVTIPTDTTSGWTRSGNYAYQIEPYQGGNDSYTKLLLHMNGNGLADSSSSEHTIVKNGDVARSATQSKFGGYSAYFDGTGDYLNLSSSSLFDLTADYTIDFWLYSPADTWGGGIVHRGNYNGSNQSWDGLSFSIRGIGTAIRFYFYGLSYATEQVIDISYPSKNEWHHFAMVKNGTTGLVYVDGIQEGTISNLNTPSSSNKDLKIGIWDYVGGTLYFSGYIDELRISKGIARWTSEFSPPTSAYN